MLGWRQLMPGCDNDPVGGQDSWKGIEGRVRSG